MISEDERRAQGSARRVALDSAHPKGGAVLRAVPLMLGWSTMTDPKDDQIDGTEEGAAYARFRQDDDDGPLQTGPSRTMKWMVWIFGVGGGIAFVGGSMVGTCPVQPQRGGAEVADEGNLEEAVGEAAQWPLRLQIMEGRVDAEVAAEIVRETRDRIESVVALFDPDNPEPGAIGALHRAAVGETVRLERPLRDALQAAQDATGFIGMPEGFLLPSVAQGADAHEAPPEAESESDDAPEADAEAQEGAPEAEGVEGAQVDEAPSAVPSGIALTSAFQVHSRTDVERRVDGVDFHPEAVGRARAFDEAVLAQLEAGRRTFTLEFGPWRYYSGGMGGAWRAQVDVGTGVPIRLAVAGRFVIQLEGEPESEVARIVLIGGRADQAVAAGRLALQGDLGGAIAGLSRTPGTDALVVSREGRARMTNGFQNYLIPDGM